MYDPTISSGDTHAIWYSTLSQDDSAALIGDGALTKPRLQVDVAVIGAGIAGLSVAYHLCKAGRSVAVFDKGLIGSGETGRTTAHLANALDEHYTELEKLHGESGARMAAESHAAAIADIERIVAAEEITCEFLRVPGLLESIHDGQRAQRELEQELEAAQRAGLRVSMLHEAKLAWSRGGPMLRYEDQAQFQPLAYLVGLARAIRRMGGHVYTRTRVAHVDSTRDPIVVTLWDGDSVSARDVVVATNSPIIDRFAMHTKQAAYRSYVLALQLSEEWSPALWWDTGDPYHYVRGTRDGLLIVGGEDHKTGQEREPERAWNELEAWARARFPEPIAVRARWSGQILEPFDGLAFIGKNPGVSRHVFIATGDSGNGMTHGALAGLLLSELIQGHEHPWSSLYDPSRKPHNRAVASYVRENINVAQHALQGLLSAEPVGRNSIPRGSGEVVRAGVRQLAMYVAEDGSRHACSAVCPHLGCIVQWNAAEKSWDCPCHGSRFDPYGRVLTGPSQRDLEPVNKPKLESHSMEQKLLRHLSHELWQTEVSASQHCRREAERLGDTPPSRALLAAAEHADAVLAELPNLTQGRPLAKSGIGMALGKVFSEVRDTIADKLLTSERSYRGTILGMRHGVDLVHLLRDAASRAHDEVLTAFLDRWLAQRQPIVDEVVAQLAWFAERPERALKPARGVFTKRAA